MNGNGVFWKGLSSVLAAGVIFLSGWVWGMEKRVTTLEVRREYMVETVNEIKMDVKEIKSLVMKHMVDPSP